MRITIDEKEPGITTASRAVPFQLCSYIKPFCRPIFLQLKSVDIIFQQKQYQECTLRRLVCFAKENKTLLIKEDKPKLVLETSPDRTLHTLFSEQEDVLLQPDEYGIIHGSTEYSGIVLRQGRQEIIRLEYAAPALAHEKLAESTKRWQRDFEKEKSWFYSSGKISSTFQQKLHDIINTSAFTPEERVIFGAKCQDILLHASEQITA